MTRIVWPEAESIGLGTGWRNKSKIFGFIAIHHVEVLQLLCKKVLDTLKAME